jgi:hypothetical protein
MLLCFYSLGKELMLFIHFFEVVRLKKSIELFNTKKDMIVCMKNKREIPIIQGSLDDLEKKVGDLAYFLNVSISNS